MSLPKLENILIAFHNNDSVAFVGSAPFQKRMREGGLQGLSWPSCPRGIR